MRVDIKKTVLLAAMVCGSNVWAGDVYVIANAGVGLSGDEVRDVFVGEKQLAGSVKLVPLDNASAQADFLAKVMKIEAAKYSTLWAKKSFRDGINPPPVRSSDAEVINAVKNTPGAVGYVSKAPADVKVIQKY